MTPEEIDAIARQRLGAEDIDRIARERLASEGVGSEPPSAFNQAVSDFTGGLTSGLGPYPGLIGRMQQFGPISGLGVALSEQPSVRQAMEDPSNLLSSDWWLTRQGVDSEPQKISAQQAVVGPVATALDALTLGAGDEIASLGSPEIYQQVKSARENFQQAAPEVSGAMGLVGAMKAPLQLPGKVKKVLGTFPYAGKTLANVAEGAGVGALSGFASTEGDVGKRLEGAKEGGVVGGAIGGALGLAGGALEKAGEKFSVWGPAEQKKALGITVADANKAAKKVARDADNPIDVAMKRIQSMDAPKDIGGKLLSGSKDPLLIHDKMLSKLDEVDDALVSVLERAEKSLKPEDLKGITPNVLDAVKEKVEAQFSGLDQEVALKHLDEQLGAYARQAKKATKGWSSGVLPFLQKMKQGSWKHGYGTDANASTKAAVDRMIGFEIKSLIENVVDKLANTGKINSGLAGQVKSLNKDMGAILQILPSVARKANLSTGHGVLDPLYGGLFRTGGSLGAMVLGGAATGNIAPAVANALIQGVTSFPTARYGLGSGLVGAGKLASKAGGLISQNVPALTRAGIVASEGQ